MQKWEYKSIEMTNTTLSVAEVQAIDDEWIPFGKRPLFAEYLKELGKEGWELVGTRPAIFIFKRPLEE